MLLLIEASSGIALELIKKLVKYDDFIAIYNKKKLILRLNIEKKMF